jgi:uncharacterized protein YyaL (SSP411 family)
MLPSRNRLGEETSPYLLQHADNPVHWYPWGDEALALAREHDRPVLLSIGYSACHWCHVMAHESFADEATASVMNELFVNIKVDREERPDLDRIYQTAHQLLVRRPGGWPLTMFLTPDQVPFFGGTYFPRESRYGLPGFADLLHRVHAYYQQNREEVNSQNQSLLEVLHKALSTTATSAGEPNDGPLRLAREQLERAFDATHGGFGGAPKFPHPTTLELLLRHWARSADPDALGMAQLTLLRMCEGGIYDHLGGGFSRYSVDEQWMIPHFEKMLYDNGPLLGLSAELWRLTGDPRFQRTARETATWVIRDMQSSEGGYYSSLDADSEGEEGRFYVWRPEQVRQQLDDREYAAMACRFGFDREPNFEGNWHLHGYREESEVARTLDLATGELEQVLSGARQRLYAIRTTRVAPGLDDKILTSWNALMIRGMAMASRYLEAPELAESATRALDLIRRDMFREGRLLATYKTGQAHLPAYLDDHAFLIDAILELLQCRWRSEDLGFAITLADLLLEHFEDRTEGGFFFTADDHEHLISRPKPVYDDSLPAGNAIALRALLRLGHLLGDMRYLDSGDRLVRWAWPAISEQPMAGTASLLALEEWLEPGQIIVLRGADEALEDWRQRCVSAWTANRLTLAIPDHVEALPGILAERHPVAEVCAYVCAGNRCLPTITSFQQLVTELERSEPL